MQVEFIKINNFKEILLFNPIKNQESDTYLIVPVKKSVLSFSETCSCI